MIHQWCDRAFNTLTMILLSDSANREFSADEREILRKAHSILSRHQVPPVRKPDGSMWDEVME